MPPVPVAHHLVAPLRRGSAGDGRATSERPTGHACMQPHCATSTRATRACSHARRTEHDHHTDRHSSTSHRALPSVQRCPPSSPLSHGGMCRRAAVLQPHRRQPCGPPRRSLATLSPPVLRPAVRRLDDLRHECSRRLVDELLHVLDRLLVSDVEPQLFLQLQDSFLGVSPDGLDARARHQMEQRQDEVGALPEDVVRLARVHAELHVVLAALAAHRLDHLPADLHGRRERLGVAAKDVAEVNVEQAAVACEHEVVQVAVAHT
mmetsp:Transcript_13205/g.38402  ORF Transcript_13205/g.38402 Transcript_13205/m.38402 type:complete len:263 (-) Transcript_13205:431-1219(-)